MQVGAQSAGLLTRRAGEFLDKLARGGSLSSRRPSVPTLAWLVDAWVQYGIASA